MRSWPLVIILSLQNFNQGMAYDTGKKTTTRIIFQTFNSINFNIISRYNNSIVLTVIPNIRHDIVFQSHHSKLLLFDIYHYKQKGSQNFHCITCTHLGN